MIFHVHPGLTMAEALKRHFLYVFQECKYSKSAAAGVLGVSIRTVYNLANRYKSDLKPATGSDDEIYRRYLGTPTECPFCGSENVASDEAPTIDTPTAYQEVSCLQCDQTWTDMYELIGLIFDDETTSPS